MNPQSTEQSKYYHPETGEHETPWRCTPQSVLLVSEDALRQKRSRYREIPGVGAGSADVSDCSEWVALYCWLLTNKRPSAYAARDLTSYGHPDYLVNVKTPAGELVHFGSLSASWQGGKLRVSLNS